MFTRAYRFEGDHNAILRGTVNVELYAYASPIYDAPPTCRVRKHRSGREVVLVNRPTKSIAT